MDYRNNIIHQRPVGVSILGALEVLNFLIGVFMGLNIKHDKNTVLLKCPSYVIKL